MRAIYFYGDYCGVCHAIRREAIDPAIDGGLDIEAVNCMREPEIASAFKIRKVPTLVVLDGTDEAARMVAGEITADSVREALR